MKVSELAQSGLQSRAGLVLTTNKLYQGEGL
jgi:hypothetical protein